MKFYFKMVVVGVFAVVVGLQLDCVEEWILLKVNFDKESIGDGLQAKKS